MAGGTAAAAATTSGICVAGSPDPASASSAAAAASPPAAAAASPPAAAAAASVEDEGVGEGPAAARVKTQSLPGRAAGVRRGREGRARGGKRVWWQACVRLCGGRARVRPVVCRKRVRVCVPGRHRTPESVEPTPKANWYAARYSGTGACRLFTSTAHS